ncbi:phage tail domain-containing protein [Paenibacillus senegalensis]|uniref:phage tail domain-containing protein n=1 Tax=Paenibacillus senegalensis TaxID=1465766 RepID=UPI0002889C87|nr:phage tail domain-containing protein [Paenibacillus senegalensis]
MSFTLGGKTARQLGVVMKGSSQRPILPGTNDKTLTIPGKNGAWDFGADMGTRLFSLDLAFITKDYVTLQQAISNFAAHLVDSYGKPRKLELRFDARPGQHFIVRYSGNLPIERIAGFGQFTLPLVAFDPYARDNRESLLETTLTTSPYERIIVSNGNIRTEPVIVLTNQGSTTITNFRITNEYLLE